MVILHQFVKKNLVRILDLDCEEKEEEDDELEQVGHPIR